MNTDFSALSVTPVLSTDILSGGAAGLHGASKDARLKAACKAVEGIFVGQLLSEIGKGLGGPQESQESGQYQDFIQQALAQQVTSGGGFGLATMLEKSFAPAHPHLAGTTPTTHHAHGTPSSSS